LGVGGWPKKSLQNRGGVGSGDPEGRHAALAGRRDDGYNRIVNDGGIALFFSAVIIVKPS
jgi:hypothetical protein